jgi:hypothetical protein
MVGLGPEQLRRIVPGGEGIRFVALGAVPGAFEPSPWTELGGPPPARPEEFRLTRGQDLDAGAGVGRGVVWIA